MPENVKETEQVVNKGFLVVLQGVEDVVGKHGMATILRQAHLAQYIGHYPPSNTEYGGHELRYMSHINHALFDIYGKRGARAILQRVGRSRWTSAVGENAALANATRVALKFLPRRRQVKLALDIAAKAYSEQMNTTIRTSEEGECFYWQDLRCGNCMDWHSDSPVCFTMVGFLSGLVAWAIGTESARVEELSCRSQGAAVCRYQISLL